MTGRVNHFGRPLAQIPRASLWLLFRLPHSLAADDFFDDITPASEFNGTFSTNVFTDAASRVIAAHAGGADGDAPLFLYLAFQNVHW